MGPGRRVDLPIPPDQVGLITYGVALNQVVDSTVVASPDGLFRKSGIDHCLSLFWLARRQRAACHTCSQRQTSDHRDGRLRMDGRQCRRGQVPVGAAEQTAAFRDVETVTVPNWPNCTPGAGGPRPAERCLRACKRAAQRLLGRDLRGTGDHDASRPRMVAGSRFHRCVRSEDGLTVPQQDAGERDAGRSTIDPCLEGRRPRRDPVRGLGSRLRNRARWAAVLLGS